MDCFVFKPTIFGLQTQTFNPQARPTDLNVNPTFANVNVHFQTSITHKFLSFMLNPSLCEGLAQRTGHVPHSQAETRLAALKAMRAETLDC